MNDSQCLTIQNQLDIIEARMQVRTLARDVGLDLFDQARISLAASTVAVILGLETAGTGRIDMAGISDGSRVGVQVACSRPGARAQDLAPGVLDDARRMVDQLRVETPPEGGVRVILIKWASHPRRPSPHEMAALAAKAGQ